MEVTILNSHTQNQKNDRRSHHGYGPPCSLTYDKTAMATYPRCVHKIIMPQKTLNQTAKIFSQDVKKHTTTTTTTKLVPT